MKTSGTIRFFSALLLSLSAAFSLIAVPNFSHAQSSDKGIEFLTRAASSFDAGDYREAASYIEEAMKTGLPKDLASRATFMRGQINERNGLLARALQDYSSALWMDSLSPSDRKKAADGKERVIAAMGLTNAQPSSSRQASASPRSTSMPSVTPPSPAPQPASQSSSGGMFGMFNGLFGSSSPPQPAAPAPVQSAAPQPTWQTATAAPTGVQPQVDATEPIRAAAQRKTPKAAPIETTSVQPPVRTASLQKASVSTSDLSGYLIVFGATASENAGRARAHQIKAQLADILVSRELEVGVAGNGQYQITAGPYKAKSAALALCSVMKQRGVACQVTP